jgi:hypothetical protein
MLFCKADSIEWKRFTRILEKYEVASGQCLNKNKTSLSSLARMLVWRKETNYSNVRATSYTVLINTWVSQLLWVNLDPNHLKVSRTKCGIVSTIGRLNSYHRQVRRFFSRRWCKYTHVLHESVSTPNLFMQRDKWDDVTILVGS